MKESDEEEIDKNNMEGIERIHVYEESECSIVYEHIM